MGGLKRWKPGIADEPWKVAICERDVKDVATTLVFLATVLTDCPGDVTRSTEALRKLSGAEIIDGLVAYRASALQSIENGKRAA